MRKIERNSVPIPTCLAAPDPKRRYGHLHGNEKEQIRSALLTLQKHCCGYCERRTGPERDDGHIEHLRKQADNPGLDMAWTNMFWSCNDEKTCGKSKDKCERPSGAKAIFSSGDLVSPYVEDPDDFFLFVTDGTVQARKGLSANNERRATETLRVFQLAESAYLRKAREDAVKPYVNAIAILSTVGPEVVRQYAQSEMLKIDGAPFSAAIRQFFMCYTP